MFFFRYTLAIGLFGGGDRRCRQWSREVRQQSEGDSVGCGAKLPYGSEPGKWGEAGINADRYVTAARCGISASCSEECWR